MENYRKIMEKKLGRKLKSTEIIHHKDGNQHNNHPDNLELASSQSKHMKKGHPTSEDWAKIIKPYLEHDIDYRAWSLNRALSAFFTERQKEIIFRKLHNQELSKTEKEYYSRTIKKRLRAIANSTLKKLAEIIAYQM